MRSQLVTKLRGDAISQRIVVERDVFAELEPTALLLVSLGDAVDFVSREFLPRIVTRNGQKIPWTTFQVLHQDVARRGINSAVRWFAQHFLQSIELTRSRTID